MLKSLVTKCLLISIGLSSSLAHSSGLKYGCGPDLEFEVIVEEEVNFLIINHRDKGIFQSGLTVTLGPTVNMTLQVLGRDKNKWYFLTKKTKDGETIESSTYTFTANNEGMSVMEQLVIVDPDTNNSGTKYHYQCSN